MTPTRSPARKTRIRWRRAGLPARPRSTCSPGRSARRGRPRCCRPTNGQRGASGRKCSSFWRNPSRRKPTKLEGTPATRTLGPSWGTAVLSRVLDHLEEWLIAALMAAATSLIFVAVLHRYGTVAAIDLSKWAAAHGPTLVASMLAGVFAWLSDLDLSWAQELCIYMFIWMAKFGAAYGVRTGIHVGVDVVVNRVDPFARRRVILFSLLCGALFTGTVATFGAIFVQQMFQTGQVSNDLEAPMWLVYMAIPLGSGLMCFRFLQVAWSFARTGDLPHHDAAHVEGVEQTPPAADGVPVDATMPD